MNGYKLYEDIFQLMDYPVLICKNHKCVDCNYKILDILMYDKNELINKPIETIIPEFNKNKELLMKVNKGKAEHLETFIKKRDNSLINVYISIIKLNMNIFLLAVDFEEEKKLEKVFNISGTLIVELDKNANVKLINNECFNVLGFLRSELLGKNWIKTVIPRETQEETVNIFNSIINGNIDEFKKVYNQDIITKNGERKIISWSNDIIKDKQGNIIGTISSGKDVTEELRAQEKIKEDKILMQQLVENIKEVFWIRDVNKDKIIYISPLYEEVWRNSCDSLYKDSSSFFKTIYKDDIERIAKNYRKMRKNNTWDFNEEYRIVRPDNSIRWVWARTSPICDEQGKIYRVVGVAEDITERKELENKLILQTRTDYLTGANNRNYYMSQANNHFIISKEKDTSLSVLMLDIDNFKNINDTYGHNIGDVVLKNLSNTCIDSIREKDIFARIGGEEFSIILPETSIDEAEKIGERIRIILSKITTNSDIGIVKFTVSIGISALKNKDSDFEDILKRADQALYLAKDSGRNNVKVKI